MIITIVIMKYHPGLKHLSMLENGLKVYKIIIDY